MTITIGLLALPIWIGYADRLETGIGAHMVHRIAAMSPHGNGFTPIRGNNGLVALLLSCLRPLRLFHHFLPTVQHRPRCYSIFVTQTAPRATNFGNVICVTER